MQIFKKVPEDYDELPEEEQQKIFDDLESVVASIDPDASKRGKYSSWRS